MGNFNKTLILNFSGEKIVATTRNNTFKFITIFIIAFTLNVGFSTFNSKAQTGEALSFDGANDYASATVNGTALTELTVSMWINQSSSSATQKGIFQWANTLNATAPFILLYSSNSNFGAYVDGTYPSGLIFPITNNVWTYITLTYKNNIWSLYKDGVLKGTYSGGRTWQSSATSIYYGNGYNAYWNGKIDEARIWNRALTACEISNYMNCEISGAQTNLMANYHFNAGVAGSTNTGIITLADSSGNGKNATLNGFALTGAASNWVAPGAVASGVSCSSGSGQIVSKSICYGDSIVVGTHTYTKDGTYIDSLKSVVGGCDSIITTNLTVLSAITSTQTLSVCAGESIAVGKHTYTTSNTYVDTLVAAGGCDSIITTNLTVKSVVDVLTTVSGTTITANAPNAGYQWIDCNNANSIITNQTNKSYTATANGSYAVVITENNCVDTSACINITNVGIAETNHGVTISLFPNPGNGELILSVDKPLNNASIKILNITGQILMEKRNVNGSTFSFDISNQAKGIYFIEIDQNRSVSRLKLIKNE